MKKEVKIFANAAQHEEADLAYYQSLTGEERIQILLELMARQDGASEGFKRVCRVIEPKRR
jgi:hypothetical protein